MKYILKITFIIIISLTFYSCSENDQLSSESSKIVSEFNGEKFTQNEINNELSKINDSEILKTFNSHFGINSIRSIEKNTLIYKSLGLSNNLALTEYSYKNSLEKIYIAQNSNNTIYYFFKVNLLNKEITIIKGFIFEIVNNKIQSISNIKDKNVFNYRNADPKGESIWCQQEKVDKGSASACEDREYDEFTEDWVGWVAYWTNPQIAILIAAMCRC